MKIVIPDDLEQSLREYIARHKGLRKGAISESIIEAIELWMRVSPESTDKHQQQGSDYFRSLFPDKFLAISETQDQKVLVKADSLEELFEQVALLTEKVFIVLPESQKKKVRLGWKSKA